MSGIFIGLPFIVLGLFLLTSPYHGLQNPGIWMFIIGALCIAVSIICMIDAYKSIKLEYKLSLQEFINNENKNSSVAAIITSSIAGPFGLFSALVGNKTYILFTHMV